MLQVLAVTGAIGSGKSLVCRFLAERGFPVYDSDSRTKALYDEDSALADAVEDAMGEPLKDSSGKIQFRNLDLSVE